MPEILTESFCERCGTRYTFESAAPPKARSIGRFKTLSKGLKNYVLSDDTSMDEAMAAARSDDERELTSHQLDAFHSTFNFCMTCRQYTCSNCWNQAEGQCLTCAPHLGREIMPAPFPELTPLVPAESLRFDAAAWPVSDLRSEAVAESPVLDEAEAISRLDRLIGPAAAAEAPAALPEVEVAAPEAAPMAWPVEAELAALEADGEAEAELEALEAETEAEAEAEFVAAGPQEAGDDIVAKRLAELAWVGPVAEVAGEPVADIAVEAVEESAPAPVGAADGPPATEIPVDVDDMAAAAARRTSALLAKFRPGQNIDAELEAFEATADVEPAEVEEPVAFAEEPAPEPVAFAAEPEPAVELVAEWPEIAAEAVAEPEVAAEPVVQPELIAESEFIAEPEFAAEPDPLAAEVIAEPELAAETPEAEVAAEPEIAAAAPVEAEPTPEPEPVRADVVEQPTWRVVAPDAPAAPAAPAVPTNGHPPVPEPAQPPVAATAAPQPPPAADPQWPTDPQWPAAQPNPSFLANRRTSASAATEALWAASARDVVANPAGAPLGGVQPCSSCGLSLSATARFCRRCGSRQGT
jgi:hypothetical protein